MIQTLRSPIEMYSACNLAIYKLFIHLHYCLGMYVWVRSFNDIHCDTYGSLRYIPTVLLLSFETLSGHMNKSARQQKVDPYYLTNTS